MKKAKGFTLIELLIVLLIVFVIFIGFGLIGAGLMGNQWFTEAGVLKKIQLDHPVANQVVDTERNVYRRSVITVVQNGEKLKFCLDSDLMFDYRVEKCR